MSFTLVAVTAVVEGGSAGQALARELESAVQVAVAAFLAERPRADVTVRSEISTEDQVRARLGLGCGEAA